MSPAVAPVLSLALAAATPIPRETPPPLPLTGLGLLVGAGVADGLGLAAHVARIALVRRGCEGDQHVFPELDVTVVVCVDETLRYLGYSTVAPLLNLAALGLAAGGGVVRGRYAAWKRAVDHRRDRLAIVHASLGASLLGLGVATYAAARGALWRDRYGARTCEDEGDLTGACIRGRWSTWLILTAAGQSVAVVGAGLLAFGVSYGRGRRLRERLARLQVQPTLAPGFAGFAVAARF